MLAVIVVTLIVALTSRVTSNLYGPFFTHFHPARSPGVVCVISVMGKCEKKQFNFVSDRTTGAFTVSIFLSLLVGEGSLAFVLLF